MTTWQLISTTFRAIAGKNWQRAAAAALGVAAADLRSTFDRDDLPNDVINNAMAMTRAAAVQYRKLVSARVERIDAAVMAVQVAADDRLVALQRAEPRVRVGNLTIHEEVVFTELLAETD